MLKHAISTIQSRKNSTNGENELTPYLNEVINPEDYNENVSTSSEQDKCKKINALVIQHIKFPVSPQPNSKVVVSKMIRSNPIKCGGYKMELVERVNVCEMVFGRKPVHLDIQSVFGIMFSSKPCKLCNINKV